MPLDAVLRAGRRLQAEQPGRFRLEAAGPLARAAEAPTGEGCWFWDKECKEEEEKRKEEEEKRQRAQAAIDEWKLLMCARMPNDTFPSHKDEYTERPYPTARGETKSAKIRTSTYKMSRAYAFALVQQAISACGDSEVQNPVTIAILKTVQKNNPEYDLMGARLKTMAEMMEEWTGKKIDVPASVLEILTNEKQSNEMRRRAGVEPHSWQLDAVMVVWGLVILGLAGPTLVAIIPATVVASGAVTRGVMAGEGVKRQKELEAYFSSLAEDKVKWELASMQRLFEWIRGFLAEVFMDYLKADYYAPTPDYRVRGADGRLRSIKDDASEHVVVIEFTDDLKTTYDAELIRKDMQTLKDNSELRPREQKRAYQ